MACPTSTDDLQSIRLELNSASLPSYVLQNGTNWGLEASLDVELAPCAVPGEHFAGRSQLDGSTNLYQAVQTAAQSGTGTLATLPDAAVVSMSWGQTDQSGDSLNDSSFVTPPPRPALRASRYGGQGIGTASSYPAADPGVLAVGGTSLTISSPGIYNSETAWSDSSGGISPYNSEGTYQQNVQPYVRRTITAIG